MAYALYQVKKHCKKPKFKITVYGQGNALLAYYYPNLLSAICGYLVVFRKFSRYAGTDIVLKRTLNKENWEE